MRITAGEFRSRSVHVLDIDGLRPTSSKVRQALFNIMGNIEGSSVLDLFSGSGVMAMEALSRGAHAVTSVEQHPKACQHLRNIAKQFEVEERWNIRRGILPNALSSLQNQRFDWVFADPPYQCGIAESIPIWLKQEHIHANTLIIEESVRAKPQWQQGWSVSTRKYGDTHLHFLNKDTQT